MTREQAIEMLEAKLKCLENITSSDYEHCRDYEHCKYNCNDCLFHYNQGNLYEQQEYLKMAIESLKEDLYNKATILEKLEQAKRNNDLAFNRYNKYYVLSLEDYYNDVNDILCNLIKEIDR
jgi:hypothetical protein